MRKLALSFFCASFALFFLRSEAKASIVNVSKEGEIVWQVLSEKDSVLREEKDFDVKETSQNVSKTSNIALKNVEGTPTLVVEDKGIKKEINLKDYSENIVEIQERPNIQKLSINVKDGKFNLIQKDLTVKTDYEIIINPDDAKVSVKTLQGEYYLSVLPFSAVQSLFRGKFLDDLDKENINLTEDQEKLTYVVKGERQVNIFDLYIYQIPVTAYVSASTGEVLKYDAPIWWKTISFLFV